MREEIAQLLKKNMADQKTKLFAFLDDALGAGDGADSDDYDSPAELLNIAVEQVDEQDSLTQGCGVGPLMGDIQEWVGAFMAGQRADVADAPFVLKIKFDPTTQGFTLFRSDAELLAKFAAPWQFPARYPVFAKTVPSPSSETLLTYLYYDEMTILP